MTITEIKRVNLIPNKADPIVVELAKRATDVLGYNVLQEYYEKSGEGLSPLAQVLAELEIEPLDWKEVKRYQLQEKQRQEMEQLEETLNTNETPRYFWWGHSSWSQTALEKYTEPIPEFVLNKAMQIKERLPQCEFYVESLYKDPDPFLIAKLSDSDQFYIEVWNEPRFEGKL